MVAAKQRKRGGLSDCPPVASNDFLRSVRFRRWPALFCCY